MKVDIHELSRAQAEITVELSQQDYQPFLKKAAVLISKNSKISGFRPGKAPYEIIKQEAGEQAIWEEALESAVKKTLFQIFQEHNIATVGAPKIDVLKLAPGNPVAYKARVNLFPKIEKLELEGIKVSRKPIDISNESIEKQLKELQKMRAKEILAQSPAKEGNRAEVDFKIFLDRVPVEGGDGRKIQVVIGENKFIPGFEQNIAGMKSGEEKKFQLAFPKNYYQRNLAGKVADFQVKMGSIYEIELPALDDAFAKNLQFENLDALKTRIREGMLQDARVREEARVEDEIFDKIIAKSRFSDIPEILIQTEARALLTEMEKTVQEDGINFDEYLRHIKKTREELLLGFTPAAVKRIKVAILFRQIAKEKGITVEEKEIEEYAGQAGQSSNTDLKHVILSRKVMDYLKKLCGLR